MWGTPFSGVSRTCALTREQSFTIIKQLLAALRGHMRAKDEMIWQRSSISWTEEGLHALEKELEFLKTVRRKEVAEKIKVALSFGDLSENSEYDEAKNEQAIMEARIADVEVMLKNAVVINEDELSNEKVHIGSKIEVAIESADGRKSKRDLKIVGSNEADPRNGKSPTSPLWARP